MANLERIYTIPLGKAYEHVRNKRGKRAISIVRAFALRHMKAEKTRISEGTNSLIFRDGIMKPPRRIKVRIVKGDDSVAKVWLIGEEEKLLALAEKKKKEEETRKKEQESKDKAKKEQEKAQAEKARQAAPKPGPAD